MPDVLHFPAFMRELVWQDLAIILAIIVASRILIVVVRWFIGRVAENGPAGARLTILSLAPKTRVIIEIAAIVVILPILVEPTFHNTIALIATVGIALAFALERLCERSGRGAGDDPGGDVSTRRRPVP